MKKVYFENEAEAEWFCKDVLSSAQSHDKGLSELFEISIAKTIKNIKNLGYIKESPVDEAEKIYSRLDSMSTREALDYAVSKQHEAIQCLKKQLGEIK